VDLEEIQPLIRGQFVRVRLGGIVPKVRKFLTLRDDIHQDITTQESLPVPPQYRNASDTAREAFRRLVRNPKTPAKLLRSLVKVQAHVPVEDWEAVVLHYTAA
jgi:hypothetical protein